MRPLRLLAFCPRIPSPPSDGGAYYVYNTLRSLAQAGHDVTLATFRSAFHPQDPSGLETWCTHITTDGGFKSYGPLDAIRSLLTSQLLPVQARMRPEPMTRILDQLQGQSFDAILIEGVHAAVYIPRFRQAFPDTPIILRQSNVEYQMLERNAAAAGNPLIRWFYSKQAALLKRFEIDAMRRADGVTAISDADATTFIELIPALRCVTIAPGCHIPQTLTPASARSHSILAISNWSWTPNHNGLSWFHQRIWPQLRRSHPEATLQIVGGGLPSDLEATLIADSSVVLHGFVPETEVFRQSNAVFIAPLLSGGGVKIKVVEAMASGIPIVTTSFGAEGLAVASGTHLFISDDADTFAAHIRTLLDSPDTCQALSDASLAMAKADFTWTSRAKTLSDFIQRLRS